MYLLRSLTDSRQIYIALTHDLATRVAAHNRESSPHTAKYAPWQLLVAVEFADEKAAIAFERYLKSGSGRALRIAISEPNRRRDRRTRYTDCGPEW